MVDTKRGGCKGASFTDKNVQIGARSSRPLGAVVGPYSEVDPNGELDLQSARSSPNLTCTKLSAQDAIRIP